MAVAREQVTGTTTAIWPSVPVILFGSLLALYVALGFCLGNAPMQDLPDHLTRAHVVADLLFNHGAQFGDLFGLKLSFSPYLAGDLLVAGLDRLIGTAWACRVWIAALIGLLPVSVWFALRRQGASAVAASSAGMLALYVATDHFFILGFANYLLSVSCAFFTYGLFYTAARTGRIKAYVYFVLLLLLSYAVHLTALIFIIAIASASSVFWVLSGKVPAARAIALMSVPFLLLLFQLTTAPAVDLSGQAMHAASAAVHFSEQISHWRGAALSKLLRIAFPAQRFNPTADRVLFAFVIVAALLPILFTSPRSIRVSAMPLVIACGMALLYAITPPVVGGVFYADVRPLQYALLFLIMAGARCAELRPSMQRAQIALACAVALANLGYVATYMLPANAAIERYRTLVARIPRDANVLPVDTLPLHYYRPFLHAGAYATLDSHAPTPYLFAADIVPNMSYFEYRRRPSYAPHESWYSLHTNVSWSRVVQEYHYMLVTVPWDAAKIPVPYTVVARNDVAALLRLQNDPTKPE